LRRGFGVGTWLWVAIWAIAAMLVAVSGASIVSGERTRQTLPVLLATPMPGAEIVRQLFAGVRRLITVLWIPFGTIAVYQYWFHLGSQRFGEATVIERLVCALLEMAIYPFLIGWIAFYVGTRVRSGLWAVLGSILAILTMLLLPYAAALLAVWLNLDASWALAFAYASPATIVGMNEARGVPWLHSVVNFAVFGGLTWLIRGYCLRNADRLLGRNEGEAGVPPAAAPAARAFSLPRAPQRRPDPRVVNTTV
jgi:hypothetical protein